MWAEFAKAYQLLNGGEGAATILAAVIALAGVIASILGWYSQWLVRPKWEKARFEARSAVHRPIYRRDADDRWTSIMLAWLSRARLNL